MTDFSHLGALEMSLVHEKARVTEAKANAWRKGGYGILVFREHNCRMIEKEIAAERKFLGIGEAASVDDISDDELLALLSVN